MTVAKRKRKHHFSRRSKSYPGPASNRLDRQAGIDKSAPLPAEQGSGEKFFEVFVILILLAFGAYHSVLYFGHQVVPNPDFPAFADTGHRLLSFQLPGSFKRAPVVGILQVSVGYFMGGPSPDLTGARVLDAILHPINIILIWLVGRRIVGKAALWIAIIASINPWLIQFLRESAAEIIMLFFVLLTYYFLFRRSGWAYLFAAITAMVRYEGAALILAVFVIYMITRNRQRERIWVLVHTALASAPLIIWMILTALNWSRQSSMHYLKVFEPSLGSVISELGMVWTATFEPLFTPVAQAGIASSQFIYGCSKIIAGLSFVAGIIYGLYRRNSPPRSAMAERGWNILAFLLFLVPYYLVHSFFSYKFHRFYIMVHWLILLICFYGLQSIWRRIASKRWIPRDIVSAVQITLLLLSVLWIWHLLGLLSSLMPLSIRSVSLPYVGTAVVGLIFVVQLFIYKGRSSRRSEPEPGRVLRNNVFLVFFLRIFLYNQFIRVSVVGQGQRDIEFKYLSDWYLSNAQPGEKLVCSMSHLLKVLTQSQKQSFMSPAQVGGDNPEQFLRNCYKKDISYIAWDSRLGFFPGSPYYKSWKMKNIAALARPRSIGPYEFVTQLRSERGFVNVFCLRSSRRSEPEPSRPPADAKTKR